jgi:hypothetical protein
VCVMRSSMGARVVGIRARGAARGEGTREFVGASAGGAERGDAADGE